MLYQKFTSQKTVYCFTVIPSLQSPVCKPHATAIYEIHFVSCALRDQPSPTGIPIICHSICWVLFAQEQELAVDLKYSSGVTNKAHNLSTRARSDFRVSDLFLSDGLCKCLVSKHNLNIAFPQQMAQSDLQISFQLDRS